METVKKTIEDLSFIKSKNSTYDRYSRFREISETVADMLNISWLNLNTDEFDKIYKLSVAFSDFEIACRLSNCEKELFEEYHAINPFFVKENELVKLCLRFYQQVECFNSIVNYTHNFTDDSIRKIITDFLSIQNPGKLIEYIVNNKSTKIEEIKSFIFNIRKPPSSVNEFSSIKRDGLAAYLKVRNYMIYDFDDAIENIINLHKSIYGGERISILKKQFFTRSESGSDLNEMIEQVIVILTCRVTENN